MLHKFGLRSLIIMLPLALLLLLPKSLLAQNAEARQRIEEERRESFDESTRMQDVLDEGFFYDYGGWIRSSFFEFEDAGDSERSLRDNDLRLYFDLRLDKTHQVYIRTKASYTDYSTGDAADGDDDDFLGFDVDQGFYRLDIDELFSQWSDNINSLQSSIIVGRQFLRLGDGFVFNTVNDGIYFDLRHRLFALELSASKSVRSLADFDGSRPKQNDSKRNFFTGQFTWTGLQKHRPFAYFLVQRDQNNSDNFISGQKFGYDSEHFGIGMSGELITNLSYHFEYATQKGDSHASGSMFSEDIEAWGFEAKLNYLFDFMWFNPRVNVGYYSGSGDRDARSITNTVGGNVTGTDDERFIEFGFTDTGFALAPRISNINIFNVGWSTTPLRKWKWFKNFQTGSQLYVYRKRVKGGVISDPTATIVDKDIGWEWDTFVNWRVLSDVSLNLQYGSFHPGDAYVQDNTRRFFSFSVTFTF